MRSTLLFLALALALPLLPHASAEPRAIACVGSDGSDESVCIYDPTTCPTFLCLDARAPTLPTNDLEAALGHLSLGGGGGRPAIACLGNGGTDEVVCARDPLP